MLKDVFTEKGISIYHAAKESGISYRTLNDIVNQKVDISNVKSGILHALAGVLQISMEQHLSDIKMEEAYALCVKTEGCKSV